MHVFNAVSDLGLHHLPMSLCGMLGIKVFIMPPTSKKLVGAYWIAFFRP